MGEFLCSQAVFQFLIVCFSQKIKKFKRPESKLLPSLSPGVMPTSCYHLQRKKCFSSAGNQHWGDCYCFFYTAMPIKVTYLEMINTLEKRHQMPKQNIVIVAIDIFIFSTYLSLRYPRVLKKIRQSSMSEYIQILS